MTARTIQGRHLLTPSSELNKLLAGVLARGRQMYEVRIYAVVVLSNHFHILAAAETPHELSRFMNFVNGNIAREVGRLHDWSGPFWHRRYRSIPIMGEASVFGRLRYLLENGVKEGLVKHPADWKGINSVRALTEGRSIEGVWIDRTALFFASRGRGRPPRVKDFTVRTRLDLDPLPGWEDLPSAKRYEAAKALVAEIANGAEPDPASQPPANDPHFRPETIATSPAPLCHADSAANRNAYLDGYRAFAKAYRTAMDALRQKLGHLGFPTHAQVLAYMASPA